MEGTMATVSGTGVHWGRGERQGAGQPERSRAHQQVCVGVPHPDRARSQLVCGGAWLPHSDSGHDISPLRDPQRTG